MKHLLTEEQNAEACRLYVDENTPAPRIAEIMHVSRSPINRALRRGGVKMRKKTTENWHPAWDRVDEVIADYCGDTMTVGEVAKKYGMSYVTVLRIASSRGIPWREHQVTSEVGREVCRKNGRSNRVHNINSHFFDCIDSEAKAYWWGFIYADGYVDREQTRLIVNLCTKDESQLVGMVESICPGHPIVREVKYREKLKKITYTSCLKIYDQIIARRLAELGIVPLRPSFYLVRDNLPADLFHHWLRGLFDGDGCAYKGNPQTGFLGQQDLLEWILGVLNERYTIDTAALVRKKAGANISELHIGGRNKVKLLRGVLYKDATIFMQRKREILDSWQ